MIDTLEELRSPTHKVLTMLKDGRDQLRVKYRDVQKRLRAVENQIRVVEGSRSAWRERAEAAERELTELKTKMLRT